MARPRWKRVDPDELRVRLEPALRRLDALRRKSLPASVDLEPMLGSEVIAEFLQINAAQATLT